MSDAPDHLRSVLPDQYILEDELGRGGMAVVYRAHDRKHDRKVAVKFFRSEAEGAPGTERFLREIRIAANLTHPHILTVHDSGETDGVLYYVMPHIEGETLRERLDREGPLDRNEALRIFGELAGALSHAHESGLVHRDIKPANVFLSGGHALLADFGIARTADPSDGNRVTKTGIAIGTPDYMSPEQWSGDRSLDQRSDVYSLACVLYEMLAGEPPFTGPTPQAVLARHSMDPVPSLRAARPSVPERVESAIKRAMAKDPAERFPSVEEFARSLEENTRPGSESLFRRARSALASFPRRRVLLPTLAVVLLVGLAYGAASRLTEGGEASATNDRMVVLPFENIGDSQSEYFAAGVTEEITGHLRSIPDLGVIGRTSASQYRNSDKSLDRIAQELDVDYVMEGSVRWGGTAEGRVRVSSRLIRASDGTQVWGENYDVDPSQVLEVQTRIARQVADRLGVVIGDGQGERLARSPTDDVAAYDLYLQGNSYYQRSWEKEDLSRAIDLYRRAVQEDSSFALAFARLGQTHAWIYRLGYDRTPERLKDARTAIERALSLDPQAPEAHVASALFYYWGRWNYQKAIDELMRARELESGNALVFRQIGNIRRRQGQWEAAIRNYERAGELDPRNHIVWHNLAETHLHVRHYDEAERYFNRVTSLAPDFLNTHLLRAQLRIHRSRDTAAARRILEATIRRVPPDDWQPLRAFWTLGFSRIVMDREETLERMRPGHLGLDSVTYHIAKAELLARGDDRSLITAQYDSARMILERRSESRDEQTPDDASKEGLLAIAYAALGRREDALAAANRAVSLTSHDAFDGPDWIANLGRVHMMLGDTTSALDQLELAVEVPSRLSRNWIRLDPIWRPLEDRPRFQALVSESPAARTATAAR